MGPSSRHSRSRRRATTYRSGRSVEAVIRSQVLEVLVHPRADLLDSLLPHTKDPDCLCVPASAPSAVEPNRRGDQCGPSPDKESGKERGEVRGADGYRGETVRPEDDHHDQNPGGGIAAEPWAAGRLDPDGDLFRRLGENLEGTPFASLGGPSRDLPPESSLQLDRTTPIYQDARTQAASHEPRTQARERPCVGARPRKARQHPTGEVGLYHSRGNQHEE